MQGLLIKREPATSTRMDCCDGHKTLPSDADGRLFEGHTGNYLLGTTEIEKEQYILVVIPMQFHLLMEQQ